MASNMVRDTKRPQMPTPQADARSQHQFTRLQILLEDYDDVIADWVEEHIGAERAGMWGIPDTSSNVLADICRQLTVPGLYGKRPQVSHVEGSAEGLIGVNGLLDKAGWLSSMPWFQYLAIGLSDIFLGVDKTSAGLVLRIVFPHNVHLVEDPNDPSKAKEHWELRQRFDPNTNEWAYYWDVWDVGARDSKGVETSPPSYRVIEGGGDKLDKTHLFFPEPMAFLGADYPWRTADGMPIIPRVHYQDADTRMLWNASLKRGIHRGTLNSALYWT